MNYDWKNWKRYVKWSSGPSECGALKISGHPHICAMMYSTQNYHADIYRKRLELRGVERISAYGDKLPAFAKCTKEELMKMDMDHILSCVHCYNGPADGWIVELFTNDLEDPEWLALLKECPYAKMVYEIPSRMAKYNIQCWLVGREGVVK
jgi:hypothetical protein